MTFKELLDSGEYILLDGAMGTMLQKSGLKTGGLPELLNITDPELIKSIHRQYIEAGAMAVYANTFGANRHKLGKCGHSVGEIVRRGVDIAKEAAEGTNALVALDIGSIGRMMRPAGDLPAEEAYDIFKEMIEAGKHADFIVLETMTDLLEIKTALLAAKENSSLPVVCTMTFEKNLRTFTGCSAAAMALTLSSMGADIIGMNCSLGPADAVDVARELLRYSSVPVLIRPNAGLPDPATNEYSVSPTEYADSMERIAELGVAAFGGCCGTTPAHIAELSRRFSGKPRSAAKCEVPAAVCSASQVVEIDTVRIIGERINPTGKKQFKEALRRRDTDFIMRRAIEQTEAGADILDINVGLPEVDEKDMMKAAVNAVQSVCGAPLQIDSSEPDVLEAALRLTAGKPIVNSVNGEDEKLDTVLPLVKKFGAAVVGLTLDKEGIPQSAEKRFEIAEKILRRAEEYGIPARDVYIDCLTLTVSAEQPQCAETLKALRMVKERLGLKTVLGVSNISFGLPNRELINSAFLTTAMANGLDLPIINPNIPAMTDAVNAYRLLSGYDQNGAAFIEKYSGAESTAPSTAPAEGRDLASAVAMGLAVECGAAAEKRLAEGAEPMELINAELIPALDAVGARFERGEVFLPQLIRSAEAAQAAFDVVKREIAKRGGTAESRGRIVLATVKGDIHDIGKNIVKTLLENYGFEVIDLGKDVDCAAVADAAMKYNAPFVGLSALMTTTLKSMEETIRLIRESGHSCKIIAGGAVLTREYALKIGADYYARDAKETVDICQHSEGNG